MVFNTLTVGAAVTPSVVETYFSHYLKRKPLRHKPTAHISYHEGLRLIREFLDYSAKHTIEDLQSFTSQWVPAPAWVRINDAEIAPKFLDRAARVLQAQLGTRGLQLIGGKTWWQWRRPESPLRAEWIEMKKEAHQRNLTGAKCERAILYIHGGAYFFGSVDEHRYQMQRHARKLRARVLAPRYRLAPQFPFPCGLLDCLASYFYLLEHFDPTQIIVAGDSAGGGMALSMLVTLRDQGQPLPAGTILLSPWVDLTHSFPSVAGDGVGDYIPPHGFHHKPSMAWPPPPNNEVAGAKLPTTPPDGVVELPAITNSGSTGRDAEQRSKDDGSLSSLSALPPSRFGELLSIILDGQRVELREQIQMYTTNELLAHPLVSPVLQPSLGGLPPVLIQVGGAELLRDEQIYLAHKAANPSAYPPSETIMREFDPQRKSLEKWPPTNVQLQVWEDLCHVPHALSFTRPAKYMYRSVAQFAAWALAHAQKHGISITNDDAISIISSGVGEEDEETDEQSSFDEKIPEKVKAKLSRKGRLGPSVGKAGDPLPPFKDHMIRQRVTRHGIVYPLAPVSEIAALALDPASIGVPKPGPVRKWIATHQASEQKFANERKKIDKKRAKELSQGYDTIPGERPPPTALVNRRRKGVAPEEKKKGRSWGLAMWSGWGSSHDEQTLQREERTEKEAQQRKPSASALDLGAENRLLSAHVDSEKRRSRSTSVNAGSSRSQQRWASSTDGERGRSPAESSVTSPHEQEVVDSGQVPDSPTGVKHFPFDSTSFTRPMSNSVTSPIPVETPVNIDRNITEDAPPAMPPTTSITSPSSERIPGTDHTYLSPTGSRPHNGVQAYPFKLKDIAARTASTATLDSQMPEAQMPTETGSQDDAIEDTAGPVELPNFIERDDEAVTPSGSQTIVAVQPTSPQNESTTIASKSLDSTTLDKLEGGRSSSQRSSGTTSSPIEPSPSQQKLPFKIRNPVFDNRTSMLGSIGADGMPNAHYAFRTEENASPTLPFKVRHTIYEPDITLGTSKITDHSNVPEHQSYARMNRESGVLGHQMNDQRIVGEQQRDVAIPPPPAPVPASTTTHKFSSSTSNPPTLSLFPSPPTNSTPTTSPTSPLSKTNNITPVREAAPEEEDDDRPPPPPPKDDAYIPSLSQRKATGRRKATKTSIGSVTNASSSSNSSSKAVPSTPPSLGELDFESGGSGSLGLGAGRKE